MICCLQVAASSSDVAGRSHNTVALILIWQCSIEEASIIVNDTDDDVSSTKSTGSTSSTTTSTTTRPCAAWYTLAPRGGVSRFPHSYSAPLGVRAQGAGGWGSLNHGSNADRGTRRRLRADSSSWIRGRSRGWREFLPWREPHGVLAEHLGRSSLPEGAARHTIPRFWRCPILQPVELLRRKHKLPERVCSAPPSHHTSERHADRGVGRRGPLLRRRLSDTQNQTVARGLTTTSWATSISTSISA